MKKFIFGAAVVAAAGFGTFTANQSNNQAQMSDLQLENVEILAADGDSMIDHMWTVGNTDYDYDSNGKKKPKKPKQGKDAGTRAERIKYYINSDGYGWAIMECMVSTSFKTLFCLPQGHIWREEITPSHNVRPVEHIEIDQHLIR